MISTWKDRKMSNDTQTAVCQRCGSGFVLTQTYLDLLERRSIRVILPVLCPTCFVTDGPEQKTRGSVKWFSPHKHYGFIATDEGEEVFFHERQLVANSGNGPCEGQRVQFHVHYPIRGPEALNVELLKD